MKTLILHAGFDKTGTSALQDFFSANRKALEKHGILYPDLGLKDGAHHGLSAHVPGFLVDLGWAFPPVLQWVEQLLAESAQTVLLSSELNGWASAAEVRALAKALKGRFKVRVVFYLRRQDDFCMADYNQQIKAGLELREISAALPDILTKADFRAKLAAWEKAFGAEGLTVRVFERQQLRGEDIVSDFLECVLGLSADLAGFERPQGNSNPRLAPDALEFKRLVNLAFPEIEDSGHFIAPLLRYSTARSERWQGQALLSGAERRAILDRFADDNAWMAAHYLGQADGIPFHAPLPDPDAPAETAGLPGLSSVAAWLAENSPVVLAFLRQQLAAIADGEAPGDSDAALRLGQALKGLSLPEAEDASRLLVPVRVWKDVHARFENENSKIRAELKRSEADVAGLAEQLSAQSADLHLAESARSDLTKQRDQLQAQLDRTTEAKTELAGQANALRAELEKTQGTVAALLEDAEAQKAELAKSSATLADLVVEKDALGESLSRAQADLSRVVAENTTLGAALTKAQGDVTRLVDENAKLGAALTEAQDDFSRLVGENATLGKALEESQGDVARLVGENTTLGTALEESQGDVARLVGENTTLGKSLAESQGDVVRLVAEARRLAEALKLSETEMALLNERLSAQAQDLAAAGKLVAETTEELAGVRVDLSDACGRVDELTKENSGLSARLDQASAAARDLDQELQQARSERDAAQAREQAILSSRSWKAAAPLRLAGNAGRRAWLGVNRAARAGYRAMLRLSPRGAQKLRNWLYPLLLRGNQRILNTTLPLYLPTPPADTTPAEVFRHKYQLYPGDHSYAPLVSIIVPNYNHAPYLARRLDSIYRQTYGNFEVLLMDDCSKDESRAVLEDYARRYPDKTRLLFNEENSGGVFFQWEKGLREAKGELIWIAESDDWASENLLETLVPFFDNPAVQLAYAPTAFMDQQGENSVWEMDYYFADIRPERWHSAFVLPAPEIVREAFALKNIVPNVSSAVFRKPDRLDVLENDLWRTMRTCGDWLFYLNLIRGGCVAYSPDARNYYRLHGANTSVGNYSKDSFYEEHEVIAKALLRHYNVPWEVFARKREQLVEHWRANRPDWNEADFDACYSLARIAEAQQERVPNLLMVGYAFCAGGGEVFPIQLANLMKTAGYNVTFLDCAQEEQVPGVRAMLARDIPVVSNFAQLELICRDFEIDVVHSHHAWVDNTILDLLPAQSQVKTVVSLHGMYETIPETALPGILPRLVKRTGQLVYTAEKNLGALRSHGLLEGLDLVRIDNALAESPITPLDRAALGIAPDAFVLTLVSRALEEKGWLEAVEAVDKARASCGRDIHLILIGEGPCHDILTARGVPAHVHLEGFRSNIRDFFAASDLGFLPSRFRGESFPLVLIDCLLAGRPMLASSVGEIPYMLQTDQGPAGELFDLDDWAIDIADLARRIAHLATDPISVQQQVARVSLAREKFDTTRMRDRYDEVYRSTLKRSR